MAARPVVENITQPETLSEHITRLCLDDITATSALKQFAIGAGLGWATGKVVEKVGSLAAVAVVGGVILFQLGVHNELIPLRVTCVNRDAVRSQKKLVRQRVTTTVQNVQDSTQVEHPSVGKIRGFYEANFFIAAGFPAGYLISYFL